MASIFDIRRNESAQQRFWARIAKGGPYDCWPWQGPLSKGYGHMSVNGRGYPVHRLMLILCGQDVPAELVTDHICRNRSCCNPAHLRAVTCHVNVICGTGPTAVNARKTHCLNGHALEGHNLLIDEKRPEWRRCRLCQNERTYAYRRRKRAALGSAVSLSDDVGI